MVLPRPTALRGFAPARLLRSSPRTAGRSQWQLVQRRGYASGGGHGHAEPSSDLPWLLSGIAVTIPSCYYLWPEASHGDAHGAHGAHEEHAESEEHEEEEAPKDEPQEDEAPKEESADEAPAEEPKESESKSDDAKDDTSEDSGSSSKSTTEGSETPEGKGDVEGVQFKGKSSAGDGEDNKTPDTRKREPDSKGGFKKRIDSAAGKNLGETPENAEDGEGESPTAKEISGKPGAIDTKQKGLSTTATRHSTDIGNDPEKSKKGEGHPETAKSMGTVQVDRPAR